MGGFIDANDTGYRDVKINVLYRSQIHEGLNMICEIQLILINYLWEKKKIHKLYSVVRKQEFFKLVVSEQKEQKEEILIDPNSMKLEKEFELDSLNNIKWKWKTVHKCSVDPETQLLGVEGLTKFRCIDLKTKTCIFEIDHYAKGQHFSHHWIRYQGKKYVTVQTEKNIVKLYEVKKNKKIVEDKDLQIKSNENEEIKLLEFDQNFECFVLIIEGKTKLTKGDFPKPYHRLQQHKIEDVRKKLLLPENCLMKMELEEMIRLTAKRKQMALSNNAQSVLIAGGDATKHFYWIDLKKKKQHKLVSNKLYNTFAPCFINGDDERCAIGDESGKIEIWSLVQMRALKLIDAFPSGATQFSSYQHNVVGMVSSQNVLCACCNTAKIVKLFDTNNFDELFSMKYKLDPSSLHLTQDLKYLTIGGRKNEMCTVYNVKK